MSDIEVNGERQALLAATVRELIQARGLDPGARGLAVALNGAVVPRARWAETSLNPGDQVEVVRSFAGG